MNPILSILTFSLLCIGGGSFGMAIANAGNTTAYRKGLAVGIYVTALALWVAIMATA